MQEPRAAGASTDRVWTLRELELLNEIQKPIAAIVSAVCEDAHRSGSGIYSLLRAYYPPHLLTAMH